MDEIVADDGYGVGRVSVLGDVDGLFVGEEFVVYGFSGRGDDFDLCDCPGRAEHLMLDGESTAIDEFMVVSVLVEDGDGLSADVEVGVDGLCLCCDGQQEAEDGD